MSHPCEQALLPGWSRCFDAVDRCERRVGMKKYPQCIYTRLYPREIRQKPRRRESTPNAFDEDERSTATVVVVEGQKIFR